MARQMNEVCELAKQTYHQLIENGVAKELARIVLPVNTYTEFYWTVNARSLINFLSLRNAPEAIREIREFAEVLEYIFESCMPVTYKAFIDADRVAI